MKGGPLLRAIASARTNDLDDVDLVALIQSWQEQARKIMGGQRRRTREPRRPAFVYQSDDAILSVYTVSEGGAPVRDHLDRLRDKGIPAVRCASPYVGMIGVRVARKHNARASRIVFGR